MEPFLGDVILLPYERAPRGWAHCEGQKLSIAQNDALFAVIGARFGGDGRQTFALPDLRKKAPQGHKYCIALQGMFPA